MADCINNDKIKTFINKTIEWAAKKYGNHPAVLGFSIGNEQDGYGLDKQSFWDVANEFGETAKKYASTKLCTQVFCQGGMDYLTNAFLSDNQYFDFWGLNVYSWNGVWSKMASGKKPVMITEWGMCSCEHDPEGTAGPPDGNATGKELTDKTKVPEYIASLWKDGILQHTAFCAGGYLMAYSDEWWKGDQTRNAPPPTPWTHDAGWAGGCASSPSTFWDEEWWGLFSIAASGGRDLNHPWWPETASKPNPPDLLTARPAVDKVGQLFKNNPSYQFINPRFHLTLNNAMAENQNAAATFTVAGIKGQFDLIKTGGIKHGKAAMVGLPKDASKFQVVYEPQPGAQEWDLACTLDQSDISKLKDGEVIQLKWVPDPTDQTKGGGPCPCGSTPHGGKQLTVKNQVGGAKIMPSYKTADGAFKNLLKQPIPANGSAQIDLPSDSYEFQIVYNKPGMTQWYRSCCLEQAKLISLNDGDTIDAIWTNTQGSGPCGSE